MNAKFPRRGRRPARALFGVLMLALFFLLGAIVQWLWNSVLPQVTAARPLNYWQAAALLLLSRILFGKFGFGPRGRFGAGDRSWQMRDKWRHMSEEERLRFREEFKERCRHRKE